MAKNKNEDDLVNRSLVWFGFAAGGYCGYLIGLAVADKKRLEEDRYKRLERQFTDLRKKVDPDYRDPFDIHSPMPVKVVSE